jgi:hypothetical protein
MPSIYRLDGVRVADDYADLWDGSIDNPLNLTEQGTVLSQPDAEVWTGTEATGVTSFDALGELQATFGLAVATDANWIQSDETFYWQELHLYAISDVMTVVPLPAAAWLFASALGVVGYSGWRRKQA